MPFRGETVDDVVAIAGQEFLGRFQGGLDQVLY
jgi:hypothetical protein